ncbi:dodecenoyl-CoA isomerase [Podochytrium sp. JEL0797]|nr:dodecenoyl-CoA isomerase [Podochytrium sp. JEL0797]
MPPLVHVQKLVNGTILRVALNAGPVNALTRPLIASIKEQFVAANAAGSGIQGIILTSSLPKVFSAGLDLRELQLTLFPTNTPASIHTYMSSFQDLVLTIASSKVPTAAVVHGACPAGGAVMAMCADYKVASENQVGKFVMGLNETRVGLGPPAWLHSLARMNLTNARTADHLIQLGHLCSSAAEAHKHGFLDTVLPNPTTPEQVEAHAIEQLQLLAQVPWNARVSSKLGARRELLGLLEGSSVEPTVECIVGDEFQSVTEKLMRSLKKK